MKAFKNKQEIKDKYITRVKAHADADKIVKGIYWENGKGCAVGCTIEGDDHSKYEKELGIPEILAHLEDGLFEAMSNEEAMKFPLRFLEATPVGADLSMVFTKLTIWEWRDKKFGLSVIKEIKDDTELYDCCEKVCVLYERFLNGEKIETEEWEKLEKLADKIYWAGAGAGAERAWAGAGAERAWARAWAGAAAERAWAGAGAERAWARAWAGAAAERAWARAAAEYEKQISITAEKLLELLREAK